MSLCDCPIWGPYGKLWTANWPVTEGQITLPYDNDYSITTNMSETPNQLVVEMLRSTQSDFNVLTSTVSSTEKYPAWYRVGWGLA